MFNSQSCHSRCIVIPCTEFSYITEFSTAGRVTEIMRPFWPFLKIMMYTLHRMYQRLLHPTNLYQVAHTVPLVYLYVPVHFLPVIYIPSTSRLSTGWTLKAHYTLSTRTVHACSSTKLLCIITTCFLHT